MNYDALMGFEIPEARQTYGPLDAVRYALSIGLGRDPLDPWQLQFVDDHKGPRIVPSFCSVLGHPGFWLADPRTTVDAGRLVHAEQGFSLQKPIPVGGTVVGETRIVDVVDKGAAKGALLYLEKTLRDADTGLVIATETRTLMLRGDGGYDGPPGTPRPAPKEPGDDPDRAVAIATRPEQALLYRLNGDPNPLHLDPSIAQEAGFERPILHGLCTFGIACHAILRALAADDPGALRSMSARFSAPVFPGETVEVEMWRSGAFRARAVERDVFVLRNGLAAFG
ncbi:MAG: MaoC/PaaZ C-terminal domain-containing protein [Rhodospirillales bacterium]|nr:MaoC/PaaZ C-terminal domain-containing protein [Rhodospirillales bacterium]